MRITASICCLLVASFVRTPNVHAAPATGRVVEVIDGDTLKVVNVDDSGKASGNPATFGIRGMAAPALDQPFGKQARDRLKELVDSKRVIWNGPVPRAPKEGRSLHFRTENGKSLALQMISEGLAWVVESELETPKSSDPKKLTSEAIAERDAREAKRGLWVDKDPMPPWEWRDKVKQVKNSLGMKLLYIPAGKFLMGSPESEPGREAQEIQHEVELTKGFYLGEHEVTVGQFKQFVLDTKYLTDGERDGKGAYGIDEAGKIEKMQPQYIWKNPGFEQTDDHPVVDVTWNDAKAFCLWLSKKEKRTYRLPTEAEWEYACRAGTKTAYAHGDNPEGLATTGNGVDATARAKYPGWTIGIKAKDGHVFTAPVGQFKKNGFGLHDMHGNVWEWSEDWYDPKAYAADKQTDPTGPATGTAKVQRGGGWSSDAKRCRSAARVGRDPSAYRGCYLGLRVVLAQSSAVTAQESAAKEPRPGLRVIYVGDSWLQMGYIEEVVKSAAVPGHKSLSRQGTTAGAFTSKGLNSVPDDKNMAKQAIEKGDLDALAVGICNWGPNPGLVETAELGLKHNPNFRVYWQSAWLIQDGLSISKNGPQRDAVKIADLQAALDKARKDLETKVDDLNKKHGKRAIILVPVGDAVVKLRALVVEGKFPSITKQSELFPDDMPHAGLHVGMLAGYCHFAAMYGKSPEGLKPEVKGIDAAQHAILQKIAWETVSKYPHAGIGK